LGKTVNITRSTSYWKITEMNAYYCRFDFQGLDLLFSKNQPDLMTKYMIILAYKVINKMLSVCKTHYFQSDERTRIQ